MASLGVEPEELRVLEQLRVKLALLANNIHSLRNDVATSNSIPTACVVGLCLPSMSCVCCQ